MFTSFNKIVFEHALNLDSVVTMRIDRYSTPFISEDYSQPYYTLYHLLSGNASFVFEDETIELSYGQILLLSPENQYALHITENLPCKVFIMAMELSGSYINSINRYFATLSSENFNALLNLIEYADDLYNLDKEHQPYVPEHVSQAVVSAKQIFQTKIELFLLGLFEASEASDRSEPQRQKVKHKIVATVNDYLAKHIYDNVTVENICSELNISKSYLSSLYKRKTGETIITHYNDMKIAEAKRLISNGSHNYTEISQKLGFSSVHYFSRLFKKVCGISPSEFEKALKKEDAVNAN